MSVCSECKFFFPIPEDEDDYEPGKGDCVTEKQDDKGKWWVSRTVMENDDASKCPEFGPK